MFQAEWEVADTQRTFARRSKKGFTAFLELGRGTCHPVPLANEVSPRIGSMSKGKHYVGPCVKSVYHHQDCARHEQIKMSGIVQMQSNQEPMIGCECKESTGC